MHATLLPVRGEQVIYHGSITEAHGPAVILGECLCNRCYQLAEMPYVLRTEAGRVLDHVRLRSFTRTASQTGA